MAEFFSRGFTGRRRVPEELASRIPPGQYYEADFPVLTAGPTPQVAWADWYFEIDGMVAEPHKWSSQDYGELPFEEIPCDIHCVTKWSKLGTSFRGVSMDTLLEHAEPLDAFTMVYSF